MSALPRRVVLYGRNGCGKTSVLESLSMFAAGRGLRGAPLEDMTAQQSSEGFALSARVRIRRRSADLETLFLPSKKRRRVLLDGAEIPQAQLAEHVLLCWLVPQMGRFFMDGVAVRRQWLDRLCARFDHAHEARVMRCSALVKERMAVLFSHRSESDWLDSIEHRLSEQCVAVTAHRVEILARINNVCSRADWQGEGLARVRLGIRCPIAQDLQEVSAQQTEERLAGRMLRARGRDREEARSSCGVHRSRVLIDNVSLSREGMRAELCSGGEQKSMLVALLIAEAELLRQEPICPSPPVLLLDDFPAHFDSKSIGVALRRLDALGLQCFYSANDPHAFAEGAFTSKAFLLDLSLPCQVKPTASALLCKTTAA